jgi:glutamyl-tRNA synthetase
MPGFTDKPVVRMLIPDDVELTFTDLIRGRVSAPRPDDQVILKADGFPTYHLAVVVDDHEMGITHVVRGEEWISSTPKHVLLYRWLGLEAPAFAHMPLLRNVDKSKISKRKNPAARLTWFQEQGYLPEALVNFLALMGFAPAEGGGSEIFTRAELLAKFEMEKLSQGGPVFDLTKLEWLNGEWIRRIDGDDLVDRIVAFFPDRKLDRALVAKIVPLIRERMKKLGDFDEWTDSFWKDEVVLTREAFRRAKLPAQDLAKVVAACADLLEKNATIETARDEAALRDLAISMKVKVGDLFMGLRVAVTGKSATPPLLESMEILGRAKSLARLRAAAKFLAEGESSEL